MVMKPEAKIVPRLSRDEYDGIQRVNWSTLKHMTRSPAHYRQQLLGGGKDSDARKVGRAVHMAIFEPEDFAARCVVWTEGRRAGKAWEAFRAANEGKEPLTEAEHAHCLALQQAAQSHPLAGKYLRGGMPEATALFSLPVPESIGLPLIECKARFDFIADPPISALVDLKTTLDASPEGFGRQAWRYRYHAQAAFYVDGMRAATGRELPYVIVAIEKEPPHAVVVYRVPEAVLDVGREEYRNALARLAICRSESSWPGYAETELELELPRWATHFADDEDVGGLDLEIGGVSDAR